MAVELTPEMQDWVDQTLTKLPPLTDQQIDEGARIYVAWLRSRAPAAA